MQTQKGNAGGRGCSADCYTYLLLLGDVYSRYTPWSHVTGSRFARPWQQYCACDDDHKGLNGCPVIEDHLLWLPQEWVVELGLDAVPWHQAPKGIQDHMIKS